jgi:hypothetical protein
MTADQLIAQLRISVIDENLAIYRTLLDSPSTSAGSDPYWRSVAELYARLHINDRETLFALMRQVSVDTLSNVCAVIDGSIRLNGQVEDVELCETKSRNVLSGALQDILLEMEENQA